jgi:hypothetical protein
MKLPVVIAVGISGLLLCAVWLVYINRASEKIVPSTLPIALGAILGIGISVFVFGSDPPKKTTFESTFIVDSLLKWPKKSIDQCRGVFISDAEMLALMDHSKLLEQQDEKAIHVYNQLLQWRMINHLAAFYGKSWQNDFFSSSRYRFQQSVPRVSDANQTTVINLKNVNGLLGANIFATSLSGKNDAELKLSLPPRSSVFIQPAAESDDWSTADGVITLEVDKLPILGPLYTVRISSRPTIAWGGTHGYEKFVDISKVEAENVMTYIFQVRIETKTSKWRSGSPALPGYKEWSDQLTEILRNSFDEQRLFDRVRTDGCAVIDDAAKASDRDGPLGQTR